MDCGKWGSWFHGWSETEEKTETDVFELLCRLSGSIKYMTQYLEKSERRSDCDIGRWNKLSVAEKSRASGKIWSYKIAMDQARNVQICENIEELDRLRVMLQDTCSTKQVYECMCLVRDTLKTFKFENVESVLLYMPENDAMNYDISSVSINAVDAAYAFPSCPTRPLPEKTAYHNGMNCVVGTMV